MCVQFNSINMQHQAQNDLARTLHLQGKVEVNQTF